MPTYAHLVLRCSASTTGFIVAVDGNRKDLSILICGDDICWTLFVGKFFKRVLDECRSAASVSVSSSTPNRLFVLAFMSHFLAWPLDVTS